MISSNDKVPVRRPGASLTPVEPPGRASGIHAPLNTGAFPPPNISLDPPSSRRRPAWKAVLHDMAQPFRDRHEVRSHQTDRGCLRRGVLREGLGDWREGDNGRCDTLPNPVVTRSLPVYPISSQFSRTGYGLQRWLAHTAFGTISAWHEGAMD